RERERDREADRDGDQRQDDVLAQRGPEHRTPVVFHPFPAEEVVVHHAGRAVLAELGDHGSGGGKVCGGAHGLASPVTPPGAAAAPSPARPGSSATSGSRCESVRKPSTRPLACPPPGGASAGPDSTTASARPPSVSRIESASLSE